MKKLPLTILLCFTLSISLTAQKGKNKNKDKDETSTADTTKFINVFGPKACTCIDSVDNAVTDKKKKIEGFSDCIDEETGTYQLSQKLLGSLDGSKKDKVINISYDKNSDDYKHYYFQLERWLMANCESLKQAIASNDEEREKSFSQSAGAMDAYNAGVKLLNKEKYADCIPYFEKAVNIDPEFAFAWDNLGICYRRTNQLDKAEQAYKASLKVDPAGKTPLQNLAVVYQMQKRDDEAIATYKEIVKYYAGDPEIYYGIGMVYYNNKKDWENALDNMCKAYNIYVEQKSPYRSDAETVINLIYKEMKKENKEDKFNKILKDNNIRPN
jgi:tetratricopeptide (TPR) repeat protein